MDSNGTPEKQQDRTAEEQSGPKPFSAKWAKEKCKTYSYAAYIHCKEWLQRPWWFQEKEPLAKFTGWVAAFTGVFVIVSALQFCTLQSTDKTTREALVTSNRAWVGPLTATMNAVQKDKGVEGTIQYQNVGREPASNFFPSIISKVYSLAQWNDGTATNEIISLAANCLSISQVAKGLQVAFPNTGFSSYQLHFDTSNGEPKIIVTDDIIAGKEIVKIQGCFAYKSIGQFHHTAFCYYYRGTVNILPILNICMVGNDAD
jgi:hypothetical protein